jgi:hypothetical protein
MAIRSRRLLNLVYDALDTCTVARSDPDAITVSRIKAGQMILDLMIEGLREIAQDVYAEHRDD